MLILFFSLLSSIHAYSFFNSWHCVGFIGNIDMGKPYIANIGELPLVFWNDGTNFFSTVNVCRHMGSKLTNAILSNDGTLQCQYHGLKYKPEDTFGKTIVFEGKLFWSFEPYRKEPFSVPFFNNPEYENSFLEINMPCSIPDGAYNTMDMLHPEYVHQGLLGFGSGIPPSNIKSYTYKTDSDSIGLSFNYASQSLATIGQNITDNYHMYRYPTFTWSRVTFSKKNNLIIAVNMLPIEPKKSKWFVTIGHNYKKSTFEKEILKGVASQILSQDYRQMINQAPESKLKKAVLFQHTFNDEEVFGPMKKYFATQYEYPNMDSVVKIVKKFYATKK